MRRDAAMFPVVRLATIRPGGARRAQGLLAAGPSAIPHSHSTELEVNPPQWGGSMIRAETFRTQGAERISEDQGP